MPGHERGENGPHHRRMPRRLTWPSVHHAEEEEDDMFPPVRSRLGAERLHEMGDRFEQRKAELGAPLLADKINLTMEHLRDLAREQQIPGRSSMTQQELAATVAP